MPRNTIVISYAIVLYHGSEEYQGQPSEEYHTAHLERGARQANPPQHMHKQQEYCDDEDEIFVVGKNSCL